MLILMFTTFYMKYKIDLQSSHFQCLGIFRIQVYEFVSSYSRIQITSYKFEQQTSLKHTLCSAFLYKDFTYTTFILRSLLP